MTQPMNPRLFVASPTFIPAPFGLLSSLETEIRGDGDQHWRAGVTYESLCPDSGTTYNDCFAVSGTAAPAPVPGPKSPTFERDYRGATAFTVYAEVDCSAVGFWNDSQALIERSLARVEEDTVEAAVWTGVAGEAQVVWPHLAGNQVVTDRSGITLQTAAVVVSGGAIFDVVEGIGRLEAALGDCYRGVGVLHVPVELGAALADAMLLVREGPRYRTPRGNIIVLGHGYPGTAPDGTLPGDSRWVYATGMPFIYRSDIFVTPPISTLDRETNSVTPIAERTYLVGWECCHVGVQIALGG